MSTPHKLSLDDFLLSLELSPRLVVELLVKNSTGGIYLLKREKTPYIGTWHLPGGFLLKNELINDCVSRLLFEELGSKKQDWKYLKLVEDIDGDPRGHLLHYFVEVISDDMTISESGKYFQTLPDNTMPHQIPMLTDLGYQLTTL